MSLTVKQHAARALGIGGSDAAAALGLSKWKPTLQLYLEKRGEVERSYEETQVQYWGKKLEPVVRQEYSDRSGNVVRLPTETLWHPKHTFMCAHVDGLVVEANRGYEGKCSIQYLAEEFGESGTDEIPDDYIFQCQHYMIVTGMPVWDLCVLIGGHDFRQYQVREDKELQEMIIDGEAEFARRVREGDPPPLDYEHRSALDLLRKLYPGTNGQRIEASEDAIQWRAAMDEFSAAEKDAKAGKEANRARLLEFMGEAALLAFPDGKCFRRKAIERTGYTVEPASYMDARFINDPDVKPKKGARRK